MVLIYSNNNSPTSMNLAVAIVGWNGLIADFMDVGSAHFIRFHFEPAEVI